MAGNQHSLEKEHAFGWWLANLSFSPTSSLSPNVCPWSAHDLPMVAPIFTGGHCKNAKKICTCNFFSIFSKFWKIAIFFEKNRFFKIFFNFFFKNFKFGITQHPLSYVHRGQKKVAISEKWEYTQKRKTCRNLWRGTCAAIVYMKSTLKCRFLEGKSIILKMNVETSFDLYILTTAAYDKIV